MILLNTRKVILRMTYISIVPCIICQTSLIIIFLNRYAKVAIFIFSPAAALMKTPVQAADSLKYYTIKVFRMNWMYGGRSGRMTGIPGELCFRIIWDRDSKSYRVTRLSNF